MERSTDLNRTTEVKQTKFKSEKGILICLMPLSRRTQSSKGEKHTRKENRDKIFIKFLRKNPAIWLIQKFSYRYHTRSLSFCLYLLIMKLLVLLININKKKYICICLYTFLHRKSTVVLNKIL